MSGSIELVDEHAGGKPEVTHHAEGDPGGIWMVVLALICQVDD